MLQNAKIYVRNENIQTVFLFFNNSYWYFEYAKYSEYIFFFFFNVFVSLNIILYR